MTDTSRTSRVPRYQCRVELEGSSESNWRILGTVLEESRDPAALARRALQRVARNRARSGIALYDLRATVVDITGIEGQDAYLSSDRDTPGYGRFVFRGYHDDPLDSIAAKALAARALGLGTDTLHVVTVSGAFADYMEGTSALQDSSDPDDVALRTAWEVACVRRRGRSVKMWVAVPVQCLGVVASHAETLLGIAGSGECSRAEADGAQDVFDQIEKILVLRKEQR